MTPKNKRDPVAVAAEILKSRYPTAVAAFVAGSFNRGEETAFSDIDLVVVFEKVQFAWREALTHGGWPIEILAHDPETLHFFFREIDGPSGVPSLQSMVLEGTPISERPELVAQLKSMAAQDMAGGPPQWDQETLYHQRYGLTDLIDDLRDPRNTFEAHITIAAIHETLANFYFRSQGLWSASGKHIPRRLLNEDPLFAQEWIHTFQTAYAGTYQPLIDLTEKILKPHGGFLFDTYRREAPAQWRRPLPGRQS